MYFVNPNPLPTGVCTVKLNITLEDLEEGLHARPTRRSNSTSADNVNSQGQQNAVQKNCFHNGENVALVMGTEKLGR